MADIFISYSHEDRPFVRLMVPALEREGFSVWWDHTIPPGQSWDSFIARGIKEAKAAIVVWSKTSAASEWVKEEASLSRETGKYLPVQMDGTTPPIGFSRIQSAQLSGWDGNASDPQWKMLVAEVRRIIAAEGPQAIHSPPRQPQHAKTQKKSGSPVAAILIGLLFLAGAGAAGIFLYLQQTSSAAGSIVETAQASPAVAAANPPVTQVNPPVAPSSNQDAQAGNSDEQLSELKRQMAETQAALADERRLREEAEKAAKLRAAEKAAEARAAQDAAAEREAAESAQKAAASSVVGQPWSLKLIWGVGTDKTGVATFHSDKSVKFDFGAQDLSIGTWTQSGQSVTIQVLEATGNTTFNCTISASGGTCSATFSTRPELNGKLVLTR